MKCHQKLFLVCGEKKVCPGLIFQYDVDFFRSVAFKSEVIEFVAILGDKSTRPKPGYMYPLYPLSEKNIFV